MRTLSSNLLSPSHWRVPASSVPTPPTLSSPLSSPQPRSTALFLSLSIFSSPYKTMSLDAIFLGLFSTLLVVSYTCACPTSPLYSLQIQLSWFVRCTGFGMRSPRLWAQAPPLCVFEQILIPKMRETIIYSFSECLLKNDYVSGTILGTRTQQWK